MTAQDNILQALIEVNAKVSPIRSNMKQLTARREGVIGGLMAAYDAYEDLLDKVTHGREFYVRLQGNINKLLTRVKSVCKVQDEERNEILSKQNQINLPSAPVPLSNLPPPDTVSSEGPKLKDYLQSGRLPKKLLPQPSSPQKVLTPQQNPTMSNYIIQFN